MAGRVPNGRTNSPTYDAGVWELLLMSKEEVAQRIVGWVAEQSAIG